MMMVVRIDSPCLPICFPHTHAHIKLATGKLEEAEKYGLDALRLAKEAEAIVGDTECLVQISTVGLANIYEAMGRSDEVLRYDNIVFEKIQDGEQPQADFIGTIRRYGRRSFETGKSIDLGRVGGWDDF